MKTKVIILGQEPKEEKKLKPIEFVKYLSKDYFVDYERPYEANRFDVVVLLAKNYHTTGYDLIYAYDNKNINAESGNCLFLGHFNDGVVE